VSVVDDVRKQIDKRLAELKPLVDEYHELESVVARLGDGSSPGTGTTTRRKPGRPRGSTTRRRTKGGARRGRRRGSGTRGAQALELVKSRPGITIPELAQEMKIKQNYLYRVMPSLAEDGKVKRDGKGWVPK